MISILFKRRSNEADIPEEIKYSGIAEILTIRSINKKIQKILNLKIELEKR